MKYIIPILDTIIYALLAFGLIGYTSQAVSSGDICRTIFGCFGLWIWFNIGKKEK